MIYRFLPLVAAFGLLVASSFAVVPSASAQSADRQQAAISQEELKTFAVAAREVQRINQSYLPSYQAAQSDEQRKAIEQEAMGKMTQAVRDKGMTIEKYNQIVQAAQADPEIAKQVDEYARQQAPDSPQTPR